MEVSERWILLGVALALVGLAACSSQPVSLSAQAGSTIGLAVAGDATVTGLGYGSKVLSDASIYDVQRGELQFSLQDPSTSVQYPLVTKLVVRACLSTM